MEITQIWRYPVKSAAGQRLDEAIVDELGVAGDRQWGLVDTSTGLVLTARRCPALLLAEPVVGPTDDELALRLPDGTVTSDEGLLSEWLGRPVRLVRPDGERAATYEIALRGDGAGYDLDDSADAQWLQWEGPECVFHDSTRTRVSIVSEATLGDWDVRRFRPNVVVSGAGEDDLVGATVAIGEAVLEIVKPIDRCVIVTRPQPGLDRDVRVLQRIAAERDGNLGVGAMVAQPGRIGVGDPVEVR